MITDDFGAPARPLHRPKGNNDCNFDLTAPCWHIDGALNPLNNVALPTGNCRVQPELPVIDVASMKLHQYYIPQV
jgi:hypothetical protein